MSLSHHGQALGSYLLIIVYFFFVICTSSTPSAYIRGTSNPYRRGCNIITRCRTDGPPDLDTFSNMNYKEKVLSNGGKFVVGFFVRGNNAYLGIWYNLPAYPEAEVIVWVANRDNPIPYPIRHKCFLATDTDMDGNAVLLDSKNHSYWSTNYTSLKPATGFSYLRISDNGNLVLYGGDDDFTKIWQSFDNPTDTFLPGMDISQGNINLTSWKGPQDPARGHYSFRKGEGESSNELFLYNSSPSPYWGSIFSFLHPYLTPLLWNMTGNSPTLRLVLNPTGSVQLWELKGDKDWLMLWSAPKDECDSYEGCGSSGICDAVNSFRCKCLPGYQPNDPVKWESQDFSGGCSKKTTDQCGDVFLLLPMIKLPLQPVNLNVDNETHCKDACLSRCGCKAYSFDSNHSRCHIWNNDLSHIEEEYYVDAHTLSIRLNLSDIDSGSRTCSICGTNVIPYPLSTEPGCGDPNYFQFECNTTNGQVYFKPPSGGAYKVSHINQDQRNFTVQLVAANVSTDYKCEATKDIASKEFNLNESSPFNVTKCSIVPLMDRTVVEAQVLWEPPSLPTCNSSADCKYWPETTCYLDNYSKKQVCMCANGFHWDPLIVNCTKDHHKHNSLMLNVGVASAAGLFLLSIISFVVYLRRRRVTHRAGIVDQLKTDEIGDIDLPFVDYQSILAATNNFSDANKLGAGGFGPVYKGLLSDGNEVAVKRLSEVSQQGVEELRNEIIVIAKLQHRNLVRVVGYCIKENEKILIYEYMPNKSLDSFLFDQAVSPLLDWPKRFNIILGIARGLLYLHQDSRLRIIHRDLKPSNVLLDEELNPKISDFGLAKIVAGNEMVANTARVVGTYGYMSPEYALDGYFSVKSDVYSFGIIVFEVITGRRCSSLLQLDNNLVSLLGYAWAMWKRGEELELTDKGIIETCESIEVKRCINVAFLCVQEDPSDRPTMSNALLMLAGDKVNLPCPKQPVFVARRQPLGTTSSSSKLGTGSNVELTTTVEGR